MKKSFLWVVGAVVLLGGIVLALRLFTPEDTRICENGQWIMHGNPSSPMPTEPCGSGLDLTNCVSYYDGCNTCFVSGGIVGGCTKMYCEIVGEPKCLEYATTGIEITGDELISDTLTYKNDTCKFTLQYPSTWQLDNPQIRFFSAYGMPLGIVLYDTTYKSFSDFKNRYTKNILDNILKSSNSIKIKNYDAIETREVDGVDSISTYIYISNNNCTIVFRGDDDYVTNSKETLLKILATLEFTN